MTFRITTLMYLFALVAVSLSAFGPAGVVVVTGVLGFWAVILYSPRPTREELMLICVMALVLAALLLPAVQGKRQTGNVRSCLHNMKELALALRNTEAIHGALPKSIFVRGKNDDIHSWRMQAIHILEARHYYIKYSFDEPWNGPSNQCLLATVPGDPWQCPTHDAASDTNYFAIVGPQTAWGDGEPRKFEDITDGASNTILLIEAAGRGIHWMEPRDLSFDEAVELLTTPLTDDSVDGHRVDHGYFFKPSFVRNVALCDGSCHALRLPIPREAAVALLTADGGEKIESDWLESQTDPVLDYGQVWGFAAFVVVALLPGIRPLRPWIWPINAGEHTALESPLEKVEETANADENH